jgi:hypothetical protein
MKKTANEKSHTADNSLALSFRTKKPLRSECSGKVQGTQSAWNEREKKENQSLGKIQERAVADRHFNRVKPAAEVPKKKHAKLLVALFSIESFFFLTAPLPRFVIGVYHLHRRAHGREANFATKNKHPAKNIIIPLHMELSVVRLEPLGRLFTNRQADTSSLQSVRPGCCQRAEALVPPATRIEEQGNGKTTNLDAFALALADREILAHVVNREDTPLDAPRAELSDDLAHVRAKRRVLLVHNVAHHLKLAREVVQLLSHAHGHLSPNVGIGRLSR